MTFLVENDRVNVHLPALGICRDYLDLGALGSIQIDNEMTGAGVFFESGDVMVGIDHARLIIHSLQPERPGFPSPK